MDKKKIISSLTLAGMLATSVAGSGVFAAETSDPATKALGEYSKLITGKVAVPFILQSEADRVTGKDVKASFKNAATFTFNSTALADDQVLATGDVVYINGEARTIVIYGDTNCDGKINIMDAVTTLNHVKGKAELTGAAFAAANLNNNKDIDIMDAVGALNVVKGKAEYGNYAKAPEAEVSVLKDVVIKNATTIDLFFDMDPNGYSYTLFDKDGERLKGQLISGASKDSETGLYKYEITSTATLTENSIAILDKAGNTIATKNIVYRALNVPTPVCDKDKNGTETNNIAINDKNVKDFAMILKLATGEANEVETTVTVTLTKGRETVAEASAKLPANTVSTSVNFGDLSKLEDDTYKVAVKSTDANGNVKNNDSMRDIYVVKASTAPVIFADATRTKINKATVTVNANKTGLTYYAMAKVVGEKAPTASELVKEGKKITIDENKITATGEITVTGEAQTIYVVAVNNQGTVSNIATAEIASDSVAKLANVTNITLQGTKYIWTDSNTKDNVKGYQVRVLKVTSEGSEIVYETPVTELVTDKEYEIDKIAKDNYTGGAKFIISVKALSNNKDYVDSAVAYPENTDDNLYNVPAIASVEGTALTGTKLTWNGVADAKSFTIKLYKAFATESGYEYKEVNKVEDIANTNQPNYEYDLKSIIEKEGVGKYTATVTAIANDNSIKVDSTESDNVKDLGSVSKIYVVAVAPTDVTVKVDNTNVTARFSPIVIPGVSDSDITYKVRVDEKQDGGTYTEGTVTPVRPAIADDEKDKVEFDVPETIRITNGSNYRITNGSDYRITIFATVTETVAETVVAKTEVKTKAQDFSTPAAMIPQGTYTVRMLTEENSSFPTQPTTDIGILNGVMKVEGITKVTNAPNYNTIKAVVSRLNAGDTITVDGKGEITGITVYADATKSIKLDLAKVAEKAELTINTKASHAIKVTGTVKSVKVKGENGVADLAGLTVSDGVTVAIKDSSNTEVLADGQNVTVKAGTKVSIPKTITVNGEVTLNGVKLKTGAAITVTANSADELTIDGSSAAIRLIADADKTVNFKGTQSGKVTVDTAAKKATLTLKTLDDSSINDLKIDSDKTTVNIVDVYMTGEVTGSKGTLVTDVTLNDVENKVKITPVSGNATVKYAGDEIKDISGNVKVEIGGLNVAENDAVTTETALTEGNSYVTVNEGVNATYTLTAGTGNGVMTITLTAGTITLGESIVYPAGTTTINGIIIKTGGATDIQKTATGLSINAGSSDVEVTAEKGETIAFTGNQTGSVNITNNGNQTVSVTGSGLKNLVINKGIVDISGANVEMGKIYAKVGASIKTNKDKEIKYDAGNGLISTINIKNIASESVIAKHSAPGVVELSGDATVTFNTGCEGEEVSDKGKDTPIPLVNNVQLQLSNDKGSVSWARDVNGLVTIVNTGVLKITKTTTTE